MRTRRRSGTYAVGRARREAILEAAATHFAEAGYASTPMARIAADVGLSERGLLHHFPTKKHLLLGVAGRRFDLAVHWVADVPETADGLRPLRALLALTEHFLARPGYIELFVLVAAEAADRNGPAHVLYAEQYERAVRDLTHDFEREVAAGLLRADIDYGTVARRCIAMCDGLQLQWVLANGGFDLSAELRSYLEEVASTVSPAERSVSISRDPRT